MFDPLKLLDSTKNSAYLDFIQSYAEIGTWEFDIKDSILNWSAQTKLIHEVSTNYIPEVDTALSFYKSGYSYNTITNAFSNCVENFKDYDVELQIVTAKGKEKWVRAIGKPIVENGKCVKVIGLFQDIDQKTKNSKALEHKEELLRKNFEHAIIGMATVDLKGNWLSVNKSLCNTFGYTKEEFLKLTVLDITHPDDLRNGKKAMVEMINGQIDHYESEKRYIKKNGKIIWASLSTSIIKDQNGKPLHFIAQIKDISHIKKSTKKIVDLLETTKNQNKRLLNFAHIVSHNLRSHYSNLDMLLDIIKADMPENTQNEVFPLIEQAVSHLGETIENLNQVASINVRKDIISEPLNLLKNYEKVEASIIGLILESKTEITVNINPDIYVNAVPAYLESILLNFLTNAIKYKKPNEIAKIELNTSIEDDNIVLEIKDNGLGIDLDKHRNKLFGMYKTFHKHEDSRGIGLFITKTQVEAIGGKIEVESKVNVGTTFKIYLKHYEKD